ncbi:hypothetical protein ACOT81_20490 [Streptomyces sp. WI04-05B]|uniref:hypothetical protein n=1 Tax=Streptomyces TaxID=1883 RepID=UPI0029A89820|nr:MULTISPECIES: hypothetical protein [unclassified Streptomyces]MDX2544678.1 hypothetical protein [Streptomyces sp. WI04-05B]MDX2588796.1 hypothetical protein [Streptomyces sp. WI04-05A]
MKVTVLSDQEVAERTVRALWLDETSIDLFSSEALSALLRRAASFLCPAIPRRLVDVVLEALGPLDESPLVSRQNVAAQLDLLVSIGDLIELPHHGDRKSRQIYLAPPSYVAKAPGQYLLLGVRPNGAPLVNETLGAEVHYEGHTRCLELDAEVAPACLQAAGLQAIRRDHWLKRPRAERAATVVDVMRQRLDQAGGSGQVDGLKIIDPQASVLYYRGRWRPIDVRDSGDFVARRPQAYGADLWCFVRVVGGVPRALVDLPVDDLTAVGCDEAWRTQAAIDALTGTPQAVHVHLAAGTAGGLRLDLFSPVPGWAQRYLELVGIPVSRARGALVSYRVPMSAIGELSEFFADMLWMHVSDEGGVA